jgi:hypothetical protein
MTFTEPARRLATFRHLCTTGNKPHNDVFSAAADIGKDLRLQSPDLWLWSMYMSLDASSATPRGVGFGL